jgi:hypothetical protein
MQSSWTQRWRVHYYKLNYSAWMPTFPWDRAKSILHACTSTHPQNKFNFNTWCPHLISSSSAVMMVLPFIWFKQKMTTSHLSSAVCLYTKITFWWIQKFPNFLSPFSDTWTLGYISLTGNQITQLAFMDFFMTNILVMPILIDYSSFTQYPYLTYIYFWVLSVYSAHSFHSENSKELEGNVQ